jgi:hypothetical protein
MIITMRQIVAGINRIPEKEAEFGKYARSMTEDPATGSKGGACHP